MTLVPDCFLSILSDIDGSLFLYYNFCLCNSLKDRAPKERIKSLPVPWDGQVSFADAKVRLFLKPAKTSATFLQGKRYKGDIYIIYIIRARKMGRGRTRLMGKAGVRWHRTIRNGGSMTGGTDGRRGCDGIAPYGTGKWKGGLRLKMREGTEGLLEFSLVGLWRLGVKILRFSFFFSWLFRTFASVYNTKRHQET